MSHEPSTAVVTGASRGIGRAIALRLSAEGYRVHLLARGVAALEAVAEEIRAAGGAACALAVDLSTEEGLARASALFGEAETPPSVLVNNAGVTTTMPFLTAAAGSWEADIQLNLLAPMRLAHAFAKALRRARTPGCLVNIASVVGLTGAPGAAAYSAAKAGLIAFGKSVAGEWARAGIRVVNISPAYTEGEMLTRLESELPAPALERLAAKHPLGYGKPEDIALAVAAVVGPTGRWMTGSNIVLDGGYLIS